MEPYPSPFQKNKWSLLWPAKQVIFTVFLLILVMFFALTFAMALILLGTVQLWKKFTGFLKI
jgi:hypothetical protein